MVNFGPNLFATHYINIQSNNLISPEVRNESIQKGDFMHSRLVKFMVLIGFLLSTIFSEPVLSSKAAESPDSSQVSTSRQQAIGNTSEIPPLLPTSEATNRESKQILKQEMQDNLNKWLTINSYSFAREIKEIYIQDNWAFTIIEPSEHSINTTPIYALAHYTPEGGWTVSLPGSSEVYLNWVDLIPKSLFSDELKTEAGKLAYENLLREDHKLLQIELENNLNQELISINQFLYSSDVLKFDIQGFLKKQPGPLKDFSEIVDGQVWSAAETIRYNSILFGINPQIILILLEASDKVLSDEKSNIPMMHLDEGSLRNSPDSFYAYIRWISSLLLADYEKARYIEDQEPIIFKDGKIIDILEVYNPAIQSIQRSLARLLVQSEWIVWVGGVLPEFKVKFNEYFDNSLYSPDSITTISALPSGYVLPFPIGETWYFTGGPHTYNSSGARPWSSVDIAQPELIACPGGNFPSHRWIKAAKGGTVIQSSQALVIIDHGDGWRTYYSHVSTTDRRGLGGVNQGDNLGHPSCETEPGGSTSGIHVHFAIWQSGIGFVNITGSSMSDWLIQETSHYNGTMSRSSVTRTATTGRHNGTNDILNSGTGGSCSAPSLIEPSDNAILNSRTITFRWNALSGCNFNGYTFRVCTSSNMDNLGSCFIDTGEGGTQRTETINGRDNQDLYWGVKAANAPSGANWAVRHFRIEPASSCSPGSNQVSLYVDANYTGQCVTKEIGEYTNPSAIGLPNDAISSVRVGSNVKAILCQNDGYSGTCDTFMSDDPNLGDNGVGDNSVSSAKVELRGSSTEVRLYDGTNYSGGYAYVTSPGLYTLVPNFNDLAESISMPAGWAVRLFEHDNYNGPEVCIQGNDSNLGDNHYSSSGNSAANSATWFEAYNQSSCPPIGYPPNTPTLISPLNGSSFSDQTSISLDWDPSNGATEYNAHLWGPGIDNYSGWSGNTDFAIGILGIGTYSWQVVARNQFGESGGSAIWSFTITSGCSDTNEPNNEITQSTNISYGQTLQGDICPSNDMDYFHFTGIAGIPTIVDIDARVNGSVLDSVVSLFDQNGTLLASNDDDGYTYDSKVGFTLSSSGDYYIAVKNYNSTNGGASYYYSINLYTDNAIPYQAAITNPIENSWINPQSVEITASAGDEGSGIRGVEFYWYSSINSQWQYLGFDNYGGDGWNYIFDTSSQPESISGAIYIYAYDYGWNFLGSGIWDLGIDRTPPSLTVNTYPSYGGSSFRMFYVSWDAVDNLSTAIDFDAQYKDGPSGIWLDWITDTTDSYYPFVGQNGHTYYFQVKAHDAAGNESVYPNGNGMAQHTVQVCPISQDGFESDNDWITARSIIPNKEVQQHNIHIEADEDWVKFSATKDRTYLIRTHNIGGYADTQLYLYDVDGTTLLEFNDDAPELWPESRIEWKAPKSGFYFVKVDHYNPYAFGCETIYDIDIISGFSIFIPFVSR